MEKNLGILVSKASMTADRAIEANALGPIFESLIMVYSFPNWERWNVVYLNRWKGEFYPLRFRETPVGNILFLCAVQTLISILFLPPERQLDLMLVSNHLLSPLKEENIQITNICPNPPRSSPDSSVGSPEKQRGANVVKRQRFK